MKDHHWWWDVPEFVQAQEDPRTKAWIEAIALGIELYEIDFKDIIPDLPDEMFSDEAIVIAERAFLARYPDRVALDQDESGLWNFVKYYGQAFVERLECQWVWQPKVKGFWDFESPAIERPWPVTTLLPLFTIMTSTVYRRTGEEWIFIFRNQREDYLQWKSALPEG